MSSSPKMPPGEQSSTGVPASKNPLKEHTPTPDLRVPFGSTSMPAKQNHIQMHDPQRSLFSELGNIEDSHLLFLFVGEHDFLVARQIETKKGTVDGDPMRWGT